jgi:hypothetical protein
MCKTIKNNNLAKNCGAGAGNLDTLAQLPTNHPPADTIGNLKKRARSKWYGNKVIAPLLYIETPLHKQYQRAYYCNQTLLQRGNTITGKYCNSRICHICNRIRTAKFMNGYGPELKKLGTLQFVTLTMPNVSAEKLRAEVTRMSRNFTNIARVIRERHKINFSGIRKIEITYNEKENTYHPHLHVIVNKGQGGTIITEWLKRYADANIKAQDCKTADKNSYNELFKYSSKILAKAGRGFNIYVPAIDIIMQAMDRKRTIQTFGKIKKISEDVEELQAVEVEGLEPTTTAREWVYNDVLSDWQTLDRLNNLTGYKPPEIDFTIFM